jgi:hypothetical protein
MHPKGPRQVQRDSRVPPRLLGSSGEALFLLYYSRGLVSGEFVFVHVEFAECDLEAAG